MDEGRIENNGTHDMLLKESKLYQELFEGEQALSSHIHLDSNV